MWDVTSTHSCADTHHANPRAYLRSVSQKANEVSGGLTASPLLPSLPRPFRLLCDFQKMTSSQDLLFNLAVESLSWPLASAMQKNELTNPAVLKHYQRKSEK